MKPATVVREEKEACGCAVENIDQEEIKVEEEESIEDEEEGVQEPEIVPSSASVRTLIIIFFLCLKKLTITNFQTMKTRSMIKAPTVCPPGFQPDRFGNCRPVF